MAQLMIALLGDGSNAHGRLMSEAGARSTLARQSFPREDFPGFTHLLFEELHDGRRFLEHGGTMMGYSCKLFLVPEVQIGVFIACNRDSETGPAVTLHESVTRALLDLWYEPPEPRDFVVPEPLAIDTTRFAGSWAGIVHCHTCAEGTGWQRSVHEVKSLGPGRLGIGLNRYVAIEPLLFVRTDGRVRMLFREDEHGAIAYRFDSDYAASIYEKVGQ
jgi:hypothetical protein